MRTQWLNADGEPVETPLGFDRLNHGLDGLSLAFLVFPEQAALGEVGLF
jgi:hypothetical protein